MQRLAAAPQSAALGWQQVGWLGAQQTLGNQWVSRQLQNRPVDTSHKVSPQRQVGIQREDDLPANIDPIADGQMGATNDNDTDAAGGAAPDAATDTASDTDTAAADGGETTWYEDILNYTGDQAAIALRQGLPEGILKQQVELYLNHYANEGQTLINTLIEDEVGLSDLNDARQGDFWQRHATTLVDPLYELAEGLLADQIGQLMDVADPYVIETVNEWAEDPWAAMGLLLGAAGLAYLANLGFPLQARQTLGAGFTAELSGAVAPLQELALQQLTLAISHSTGISVAGYVTPNDSGDTYGGRISYTDDDVTASLDVSGRETDAQTDDTGAVIRDSQTTVGVTGQVNVEGEDFEVGTTVTVRKSEDYLLIEIPTASLQIDQLNLSANARHESGPTSESTSGGATVSYGDTEDGSFVTGAYAHSRTTTEGAEGPTESGRDDVSVTGRYEIDDEDYLSGSVGAAYDVTTGNWTGRTSVTLDIDGHAVTVNGTVEFAEQNIVTIKIDYDMLETVLYSLNIQAGDDTGIISAGTRLEVKDLGGLVDNLDVYGTLQAGQLADPGAASISEAMVGVNYRHDFNLLGTDFAGVFGVEAGQTSVGLDDDGDALQAGQVNFNVGFEF